MHFTAVSVDRHRPLSVEAPIFASVAAFVPSCIREQYG
jgi:hypothetical protein